MSSWSDDLLLLRSQLERVEDLDRDATEGSWISQGITPDHGLMEGITVYQEGEEGAVAYVQPDRADAELVARARTLLPQLARALRSVLEHHPRKTAMDGNLDYCPRCVDHEGALWPCETVRGLLTAWEGIE